MASSRKSHRPQAEQAACLRLPRSPEDSGKYCLWKLNAELTRWPCRRGSALQVAVLLPPQQPCETDITFPWHRLAAEASAWPQGLAAKC